jgi:hypothetical protein
MTPGISPPHVKEIISTALALGSKPPLLQKAIHDEHGVKLLSKDLNNMKQKLASATGEGKVQKIP